MDPRKLLYLVAIIEHGSFKKAARHLQISQPALSTSMDRLEQSLGRQLLERGPTGVSPTSFGEALYAHARLIRDELDLAGRRMTTGDKAHTDVVAFGTLPSLAMSIVPAAICQWRETQRTAMLRVVENNQLELFLSLLRGDLNFIIAMTESYGFTEGLRQRVLFRDRIYVVGRPGHPVTRRETLTWADLAQFPWIFQLVGRQKTILDKMLASEGVGLPEQMTECGSVECIASLVAGSDSLALLPAIAIKGYVREGRIVPIDIMVPLLNRSIAVIFRERFPLSTAARSLVDEIEAVGTGLGDGRLLPR